MFAVIETGGKQYKVAEGTIIDVEKLNCNITDKVVFDKVLLFSKNNEVKIGQPYLENIEVTGTALNQIKDKKVIVFKFKRKTGYKKTQGHRQQYTTIKITKIDTVKKETTTKATKEKT
jgi:large subunit ribosomal protein L21